MPYNRDCCFTVFDPAYICLLFIISGIAHAGTNLLRNHRARITVLVVVFKELLYLFLKFSNLSITCILKMNEQVLYILFFCVFESIILVFLNMKPRTPFNSIVLYVSCFSSLEIRIPM